MLLGLSETLRDHESGFINVDRKQKICHCKEGGLQVEAKLPFLQTFLPPGSKTLQTLPTEDSWPDLELQRAADRIVLSRLGPPGLIVDDKLTVLQVRGQTAPYVELSSGSVS